MTKDNKKNTFDALFDLFEQAQAFYDENEDTINQVVGGSKSVSLEEGELLQEAYKQDDAVIIVAETKHTDMSDINFQFDEEEVSMTVTMGDENLKVMMPQDVKPQETEARIKNGVLRAEIPRENEEVSEDGSDG